MALSIYQMRPEDCSHSAFYPGEARCPWCGYTRVEIEQMGVPERWMDATTFVDADNGIRREVSNLGGKRVKVRDEAIYPFYPPLQSVCLKEGGSERIDTVEEARAVGDAMLADLKAGLAAEACAKNGHKFITHRKLCMVCGITEEQCATLERAAYEYVVGRNAIPAVAGEDLRPGDVVTVRDGKAYRMPPRTAGPQQHTFTVSKETFDAIMKSGCTRFSIGGTVETFRAPTLMQLGDDWKKESRPHAVLDLERNAHGVATGCRMANLDATHPKPFVHPRSLKGNVNVAPLAVDDPTGSDVCEEW